MNALEVKETTILKIVPDGIVDEVNHYKNNGRTSKRLFI